jgi:hypothetical protein
MQKDRIGMRKAKDRTFTAPDILLYLAQNEGRSKWEIAKGLKKSYGNVHAAIQQLLSYRLIKIEEKRPSAKNRKIEVEYYGVTIAGLMLILSQKEGIENVNGIVERQKDMLPLIFGKWRFYEENGCKAFIIGKLEKVAKDEAFRFFALLREPEKREGEDLFRAIGLSEMRMEAKRNVFLNPALVREMIDKKKLQIEKAHTMIREGVESMHKERITENVLLFSYNPLIQTEVKAQQELLFKLKKDKDLKAFVKAGFERLKSQYEFGLENIRVLLKTWEDVQKPARALLGKRV